MTSSPSRAGRRPVSTRAALVRRAALPALLLAGLGAGAGVVAASQVPQSYTAEATVLLNPLDGNPFHPGGSGEDLINLTTEAEIVRSDAVARLAATDAGSTDPGALLTGLGVEVLPNTQILDITVTARNGENAVRRAQAFADAYLDYRIQRATKSTDVERTQLQAEITERNSQLEELSAQYAAAVDDPPKAALISAQIQTTTTQLAQLNARLVDATSSTLDPGQVVTIAALQPEGPLSMSRLLPLVGAAGGVALAVAGAWLYGRRNRAVKRWSEADELLPVVASVGATGSVDPWAQPVSDDYRTLRAQLPSLLGDARPVLAVLTSSPHAAAEVAPLALATGAAGMRTVVVDLTDELPPSDRPRGEGLAGLLVSTAPTRTALVTAAPRVRVLPPGVALARVADLVAGAGFGSVLADLLHEADLVIVAARLHGGVADAAVLQHVSAALVEVRLGATRTGDVEQMLEAVRSAGVERSAALVVTPAPRRPGHPAHAVWNKRRPADDTDPVAAAVELAARGPRTASSAPRTSVAASLVPHQGGPAAGGDAPQPLDPPVPFAPVFPLRTGAGGPSPETPEASDGAGDDAHESDGTEPAAERHDEHASGDGVVEAHR